jgi:membrane protein GlpM
MAELVAHATIGALIAVGISLISRSSVFFLSGLLPLFPTFALYAHLQAFSVAGNASVKLVAGFGLMSLVPYAVYLVGLLALIDRVGFRLAVALALLFWTSAAAVMIGLWRMLDVESLV